MPWSIKKQDGKHCVVKDDDGSVEKCHATRQKAKDHMAALYASESKEKAQSEPEAAEVKMYGEVCYEDDCDGPYLYSEWQAERDAMEAASQAEFLANLLPVFVMRIFKRPDVENKMAALERLTIEFTQEMRQAVGAEMKEAGDANWFDDLVGRVKDAVGLKPKATQEPVPSQDLMLWKEADGTYRWIATYSNNYRDDDNPPEIIAAKSHQRFDELLTKGEAPMPRLWLWHVKEWEWGEATWHAFDDLGFPVAGGVVHKGCEPLAEAIAANLNKWAVSHGMPKSSIKRDAGDPSVIVEHITSEISPLPAYAAANKGTGFSIVKEVPMAIPQDKRDQIVEGGLDPSVLDAVEAANAQRAEAEAKAGTEQKEKDQSPTDTAEPEPVEAETQAEAPATDPQIIEAFQVLGERLDRFEAAIEALSKEITALKEADATKIAKAVEETPAASLADLIRGGSAVGSEAAKIDGRTSLAKQGPQETEAQGVPQLSPVPFLNQLVAPRQ